MLAVFSKKEIQTAIQNQRIDLIQMVSELSVNQLKHASLCAGWKVENVLGHILGFELSTLDLFKLLLRFKSLDDITADQARRYEGLTPQAYARLLKKGVKRLNRLVRLTPSFSLNLKWIPVPHGRLSLGQLYGDVILDRAIHKLDITHPLGLGSEIKDEAVLKVCLKFVLQCLDLVEDKIPQEYYGKVIRLNITGKIVGEYEWVIGKKTRELSQPRVEPTLIVRTDINNFLFIVTDRRELIKHDAELRGDETLANIIRSTLNANALWDA